MKKPALSGKILASRLILKIGCVLFLLFFVFFSLAAPQVTQFGSALFILLGMVLAPLMNQDQLPGDQLPPQPEHVCRASAFEWSNSTPEITHQTDFVQDNQPAAVMHRTSLINIPANHTIAVQKLRPVATARPDEIVFPETVLFTRLQPVRAGPFC